MVKNTILAFPPADKQLSAEAMSKYVELRAKEEFQAGDPVTIHNVRIYDKRQWVRSVLDRALALVRQSGAVLPASAEVEISHHRGVEQFEKTGCVLFTIVNRESYCKKIIVLLPGQEHPEQWHERKEETFVVLWGDVYLTLDGEDSYTCIVGEMAHIRAGLRHSFRGSPLGAVIEEVSTRHDPADSHYTDPAIQNNPNRKTRVQYWSNP